MNKAYWNDINDKAIEVKNQGMQEFKGLKNFNQKTKA